MKMFEIYEIKQKLRAVSSVEWITIDSIRDSGIARRRLERLRKKYSDETFTLVRLTETIIDGEQY